MSMRASNLARLVAFLLATMPLPGLTQPPPPPLPVSPSPAQPVPTGSQPFAPATTQAQSPVQAATEQRISGLQTQLAITPAQMPQWNAFAQVMRENAQTTDTLFRQRATGAPSMNAAANMESYAQISRAYADGTEKLSTAFQALYGTLSDQQKQAADTLFRQQAAQSAQPQAAKLK
jgi:protein CpxP